MCYVASGFFFITGNVNRKVTDLPGVTVVVSKGPEGDRDDTVFGQMFIAGECRWTFENSVLGKMKKLLPLCEMVENYKMIDDGRVVRNAEGALLHAA